MPAADVVSTPVAHLVLAAGAGRRLGGPKALARWSGTTFVERAVALGRAAGCEPSLVVVGSEAARVTALVGPDVAVSCPLWRTGLAASLRAGLAAAGDTRATAVVVTLVDQPLLGAAAIRRLVATPRDDAGAVVATYGGRRGHPVLLDRSVWAEVAASATGDSGAGGWLRTHPGRVLEVDCDGTGRPDDVDTEADLARLDDDGSAANGERPVPRGAETPAS